MACRPKFPTGEKKTPKFQAPVYYPTDDPEQLQRLLGQAFGGVEADLAALHKAVDTPPQTQPVTAVSGTVMAKAGDVLRLMPGAAGIQVLLPTARSANKGDDVSIIIVAGATGTVTVRAVEGKVQNAASITLTGGGLRVFRSDGGDGTATGAGGWWIVGKNSADSSAILQAISAGTQLGSTGTIAFANSNGVSFGMNGSSQITASLSTMVISHVGGNSISNATRMVFVNASGVTWSLSTAASIVSIRASVMQGISFGAGTTSSLLQTIEFDNSNGISFGMNPVIGTGFVTASYARELGAVSHVGGNSQTNVTQLAFSNASNVSWSLSTAASAVTVLASVVSSIAALSADQYGGVASSGTVAFVNRGGYTNLSSRASSGNVLFSINGQSIEATAVIGIADSLGPFGATQISFSNANGISWGLGSETKLNSGVVIDVTASYAREMGLVSHIGGNVVSSVTRLAFSNASNVTWSLSTAANAATVLASVAAQSAQTFIGGIAGGTQTATSGTVVFSNSNDFTFGLSGSTRMTASYLPQIGLVSHIGGNVVSSVTRLAFSNASNVTWSLSTAANAATVIASVAAGGGGGIALADVYGNTISNSTVVASIGINSTLTNLFSGDSGSNNLIFGLTGSTLTGFAYVRLSTAAGGNGSAVQKINFINSNGVSWGLATTEASASAREINVTAKHADLTMWNNFIDKDDVPADNISNLASSFPVFPIEAYPFPGNMTLGTLDLFVSGGTFSSTQCTNAWGCTFRGGLYSLNNSTQLTLLNSWSSTLSSTTINSTASSSRNNVFGGGRVWSIHSSLWSSQPVLSMGVQYWMAINLSVSGASNPYVNWYRKRPLSPPIQGFVGDSSTIGIGSRLIPFLGHISTGSPPNSIGSANMLSNSAGSAGNIPIVQFKTGISA